MKGLIMSTKEVQMTIRIEPELRASFTKAAEIEFRPASQVLRDLMRGYVKQVRERSSKAANESISEAEFKRRQRAFDFATASAGLEGIMTPEELQEQAKQFIDGDITLEQFMKMKPHSRSPR
jgi:hypothetical protein